MLMLAPAKVVLHLKSSIESWLRLMLNQFQPVLCSFLLISRKSLFMMFVIVLACVSIFMLAAGQVYD